VTDVPGQDRGELRMNDRREEAGCLLHELRQPRTAQGQARVEQALVLAVQGQVPAELVHQHAGDEAHVGTTALEHACGRRGAVQGLRVEPLDCVFQPIVDGISG